MADTERLKRETAAARSVWNEHEDELHRADNSHYRGVGRWADDAKWQSIGRRTRADLDRMLRFYDYSGDFWATPRAILEWGPGGGANAFAFRDVAKPFYGVDISEKNLAECGRMLTQEGSDMLRPILIEEGLDEVVAAIDQPIDVFFSIAVFQHFPSKAYGQDVLRLMYEKMAPFSLGMVQIRYDNGNPRFKPIRSVEEYQKRHITATSYALDEFHAILQQTGFEDVFITEIRPRSNYAFFHFRKGKPGGTG